MGRKKSNIRFGVGLSIFLFLLLSLNLVAAADDTTPSGGLGKAGTAVTKVINGLREAGSPIFNALFGTTTDGGELFTKVLYFIIVTLIVMAVLCQVTFFYGKK